jgi:predicted esterase YcpF (UPF0227 family)
MKKNRLLYLHGFKSSPQSYKAQRLMDYMQAKGCDDLLICPQLPVYPEQARLVMEEIVERALADGTLNIAGSSLGGYYATYLAEKYETNAVLVNPSVKPYETLAAYLGENKSYYSDDVWNFDESHIEQLKTMDVDVLAEPARYYVLLQTGDETLDYRQAADKYKQADCIIEQGGDHSFTGFDRYIPKILQFSKIDCA